MREVFSRLFKIVRKVTTVTNLPILFVGIYGVFFISLLYHNVSPFGIWGASYDLTGQSRLLQGPTPESRAVKSKDGYRVIEPPVYFYVQNPKKFDQAVLTAKFRTDAPIIEAGVVKRQDPWAVERHTLYNKYLEELTWPRIEKDGFILWQRKPEYKSVEEFLKNPPAVEKVTVVDASLNVELTNQPINELTNHAYNVSLRGAQDIYVFTQGEDLDLRFFVQDMNRHDGADPVTISACDPTGCDADGLLFVHADLPDDGDEWGSQKSSAVREIAITSPRPEHGMYHIRFNADEDVFIRRIETRQQHMVFKNQLYLGDEVGYRASVAPLRVWSNGQGFAIRTPHPESIQTVAFRGNGKALTSVSIDEHNHQYEISIPQEVAGGLIEMVSPKRDLSINTDGFFSFTKESFFLPEPIPYASDLDLDARGINYVFARYSFSRVRGSWNTARVKLNTYDVDPISPLTFFFGIPHGQKTGFELGNIAVSLRKPGLTPRRIFDILYQLRPR